VTVVLTEPEVVSREAQPYLGIRATVTMQTIGPEMPRLFDELHGWIERVEPAGPVFARYLVIDMERELVIEAGLPVAAPERGEGHVVPGELPAGRYLTALHTGPYERLEEATGRFLAWAQEHGHRFDVRPGAEGEEWGSRLEEYESDPSQEPDPEQWRTRLAFRLAD
jgi:effector-binding domain-containing protein